MSRQFSREIESDLTLVGFFLGKHDSNLTCLHRGRLRYVKTERLVQIKHHRADLNFVKDILKQWGISKIDALCFSDGDRNALGSCPKTQLFTPSEIQSIPATKTFCIDHHYAHALSVWPLRPSPEIDKAVIIDGRGDHGWRGAVFRGCTHPQVLYRETCSNMSTILNEIGQRMGMRGLDIDYPGKLMGAQAYGSPDADYVRQLRDSWLSNDMKEVVFNRDLSSRFGQTDSLFYSFDNPDFRDWLASIHLALKMQTVDFFKTFCLPDETIFYAGGCAQNSVINSALREEFPKLIIPPHAYDGGLSLGCLEFLRLYFDLPLFTKSNFPFWQEDENVSPPTEKTIRKVAQLLMEDKIVGWFQGRGEIGPRALGHRSILASPSGYDLKNKLNLKIKLREPWRPYGASVLAEKTHSFFATEQKSPYMLYTVPVLDGSLTSITHVDGTCRIQTVDQDGGGGRRLLECFDHLTGIPVLLNTSLNLGGKPLAGTRKDALELFENSKIDALCIGDTLLEK